VKYFFFENFAVYYLFIFFIIFDILFSIPSICTCQKILEIYLFILCIRHFITEFWKIVECFLKKYRDLESKILHKFHRLLFVFFYSFSILVIFFFLFHESKPVKKF